MNDTLRVLFVEDREDDTLLQIRELRRAGWGIISRRVETEADLRRALAEVEWDIVLSDYAMPQFNGLDALRVVQEGGRDIPFILLSGTVGEEVAVQSMRAGAADYLLKSSLTRLAPAVRRELREAASRRRRRHAEKALNESRTLLSLIYDHTSEMLALFSAAGNGEWQLASANRAWLAQSATLGRPGRIEDISGSSFGELLAGFPVGEEEKRELLQMFSTAVALERSVTFELSWRHGPRETFTEQCLIPVRSAGGACRHLLWASRDVSERRQADDQRRKLETQLMHSQKLEALGTLASSIAHDFNNILTGLTGHVQLVRADTADLPHVRENIQQIFQGIHRATELSRQILSFGRKRPVHRQPMALGPVVYEALAFLRPLIPARIRVSADLPTNGPLVEADAGQIHQAVINLCTNAVQAMSESGGLLEVSLATEVVAAEFASRHPPLVPGTQNRLRVRDTGKGMDEDTLARLFEPFFSTRAEGVGAGLGMAVVQGVVENHRGCVVVTSKPGAGTTFDLYFPLLAENPSASPWKAHATPPRLLFVDDQVYLAHLGEAMLGRLGFEVSAYSEPEQALEAFLAAPDAFAGLITDLDMPGMRGTELADRMRQVRPDLPVILATGYSGPLELDRARADGFPHVLEKPFTVENLIEMLRRAIPSA